MKIQKPSKLNARGDTIIEVLVAIAVLGAVLGAAYVATNRNALTSQASQERLSGIKLAESQLELLKAKSSTSPDEVMNRSDFCMNSDSLLSYTDVLCAVDSSGVATGQEPVYHLRITKKTSHLNGAIFEIAVTWANVKGTGEDSVTYQYGVYR